MKCHHRPCDARLFGAKTQCLCRQVSKMDSCASQGHLYQGKSKNTSARIWTRFFTKLFSLSSLNFFFFCGIVLNSSNFKIEIDNDLPQTGVLIHTVIMHGFSFNTKFHTRTERERERERDREIILCKFSLKIILRSRFGVGKQILISEWREDICRLIWLVLPICHSPNDKIYILWFNEYVAQNRWEWYKAHDS